MKFMIQLQKCYKYYPLLFPYNINYTFSAVKYLQQKSPTSIKINPHFRKVPERSQILKRRNTSIVSCGLAARSPRKPKPPALGKAAILKRADFFFQISKETA